MMNCKSLLILLAVLFTGSCFGQAKVFLYNEIQCRNQKLQWEKAVKTEDRVVYIDEDSINVTLDKDYHLTIVSARSLPNSTIFLCKDSEQKDVTVTLVDNSKMLVYNDTKRYQITFKDSGVATLLASYNEVKQ